jgi:hypothetical protein
MAYVKVEIQKMKMKKNGKADRSGFPVFHCQNGMATSANNLRSESTLFDAFSREKVSFQCFTIVVCNFQS